jgi:hypothetical protein
MNKGVEEYAPTYKIVVPNWLFYMVLDQFAPTWQVDIAVDWEYYKLLD